MNEAVTLLLCLPATEAAAAVAAAVVQSVWHYKKDAYVFMGQLIIYRR